MVQSDVKWLYRQADLILGPSTQGQILQKIASGELVAHSEVQMIGTSLFVRLGTVQEFSVALAKAETKRRVDAETAEHELKYRKKRNLWIASISGVLAVVLVVVAIAARYVAINSPFKSAQSAGEMITMDAISISRADARGSNDDYVRYTGPGKKTESASVGNKATGSGSTSGKTQQQTDADGLQAGLAVDKALINEVVEKHRRSLNGCFGSVVEAGIRGQIPIEFIVGNNGKVAKVWVDRNEVKQGALPDCLLREMQKWPFKPYAGDQASVHLSFNIGNRN